MRGGQDAVFQRLELGACSWEAMTSCRCSPFNPRLSLTGITLLFTNARSSSAFIYLPEPAAFCSSCKGLTHVQPVSEVLALVPVLASLTDFARRAVLRASDLRFGSSAQLSQADPMRGSAAIHSSAITRLNYDSLTWPDMFSIYIINNTIVWNISQICHPSQLQNIAQIVGVFFFGGPKTPALF